MAKSLLRELLFESPFMHSGEYKPTMAINTMTLSAIKREFGDYLIKVPLPTGEEAGVYVGKNDSKNIIRIIKLAEKSDTPGRFEIIGQLLFKDKPAQIPGYDNIMQVDSAYIEKEYRTANIFSNIYAALVKSGVTLVSDTEQFPPGASLWKSIARELSKEIDVLVYDIDYDRFITDKEGNPLKYDGSNIPDSEFWSSGEDYSKFSVVFVASKQ